MLTENKIDVIVVGAGPSGIACALCARRGGLNVVVIEKSSHYGTKNMFGGAVYLKSIKELFPNSYQNAPYERFITNHEYVILNKNNSISVSYKDEDKSNAASVFRYNFDSWLVFEAKKEGVFFAPNSLVTDLIYNGKKIIGVKTKNEEIFAKIVVIAEGFNSILLNKHGLKPMTKPKSAILGIKETIKLPRDAINSRFNLKDDEGVKIQFFGGLASENEEAPFGMGFLYTFKNMISIGAGISTETLNTSKIKPYEYLNRLKENKYVANLIEGGEVVEYSAHSIPEGGYKEIPRLYDDGLMVIGDAANLVNSVHFEGTNLAIKSGILAGETAVSAFKKGDFSKRTLAQYKKNLYKSFVVSDMKAYKNVIETLFKKRNAVFSYYPEKIGEFFEIFTKSDNAAKKKKYRKFIYSHFVRRGCFSTISDVISFVKCVIEAII